MINAIRKVFKYFVHKQTDHAYEKLRSLDGPLSELTTTITVSFDDGVYWKDLIGSHDLRVMVINGSNEDLVFTFTRNGVVVDKLYYDERTGDSVVSHLELKTYKKLLTS